MAAMAQKQASSPAAPANRILPRKCDKCRKKKGILQRSAFGSSSKTAPPIVHEVPRSPGQPLDQASQTFIRPHLSYEFGRIPVLYRSQAGIQAKLVVNAPGDIYEQEADRVADQVLAVSSHPLIGGASLRIQRLSGQLAGQADSAPTSVNRVLTSPGSPLEPAVRRDMEQRFGYSFSRVRVHTGTAAEQSARDVNARAYTVGQDIVFGMGQFAPGTHAGRQLLSHELTHVVQQSGADASRLLHNNDNFSGATISQPVMEGGVIVRCVQRQPASSNQEIEKEYKEERKRFETSRAQHKKRLQVEWHMKQQRNVADFLDRARKLQPDPKKGLMDPDNLFCNTVELLDSGKFTLTIMSPTHYRSNLYFDITVPYPKIGGDYPAEPNVPGKASKGLFFDYEGLYTNALGANLPPPSTNPSEKFVPTKVERAPGETQTEKPRFKEPETVPDKTSSGPPAAASFIPGNIYLFTHDLEITEDQFKNTLVHEGQHIADLETRRETVRSSEELLAGYKSEFRAFWIQPPVPPSAGLAGESINRLPEPTGKAWNLEKVSVSRPEGCKICPPSSPYAPSEVKTGMKNPRQEEIFRYILSKYKIMEYDCCYVFNDKFRKEVNQFAFPQSINLINSDRLMNLNLELQKLNKSMTMSEVSNTRIVVLLTQLEPLDWIFLKDRNLSNPFWEALKIIAPKFVYKGVSALVQKGTKIPVSEADVHRELTRN